MYIVPWFGKNGPHFVLYSAIFFPSFPVFNFGVYSLLLLLNYIGYTIIYGLQSVFDRLDDIK